MNANSKLPMALLVVIVILIEGRMSVVAAQTDLEIELRALDAMRAGADTPVGDVEVRGRELLEQYSERSDQALIYYTLAHVHAQSGQVRPDLVISHCEAGLARPLSPEKRLQLYIYYGDALQSINSIRTFEERLPFSEIRKKAAEVYLMGLRDSVAFNLPIQKPEIGEGLPIEMPVGNAADPKFQRKVAEIRKQNEDYAALLQQIRRDQVTWENRRILFDQLVYLYLRDPDNDHELRELASESLPCDMVVHLFDRFQEKSGTRQQPLGVVIDPLKSL